MNEALIDTTNLDDIPNDLKNELKKRGLNGSDEKILSIISEFTQLSIDEMLIGLFRKYNISKKRTWLANRLFVLSKLNKVKKVSRGRYELVKS
jgi:hypothetical protein